MDTQREQTQRLSQQPKVRCFGDRAALCAEASSRVEEGTTLHAINLEMAPRQSGEVVWSRKINIELSTTELPLVCGVGLGLLPSLRIERPGKAIDIQRQDNKLYVRGFGGDQALALPITMGDTFRLTALLLMQLQKQCNGLEEGLLMAALRGALALYRPPETEPKPQTGRNPEKSPRLR